MKHTVQCLEVFAEYGRAMLDYEKQWPNYCRTCGGWGGHAVTGCSVPYGSTTVNLPDEIDPCSDCAEHGECPRCGSTEIGEEGEHCPACGWNWENSDGAPAPPECFCYMLEEEKTDE